MKKYLKLAIVFLAFFAAGCTKNEALRPRIEFWTIQLKPVFTDYIQGMIGAYEKSHPGISVVWVDVPFSGVREKLMTSYLAGTPPDVVNLNVDMAVSLAEMGALADLEPLLAAEVKKDYIQGVLDSTRVGNSVYAVPWYLSTAVTIYNKDILAKAGIPENRVPANYAELETAAKAIQAKTGKFAICPKIGKDTDLMKFFAMNGVNVYEKGKVNLTDPAALETLAYWKRMFKSNLIPRASIMEDHRVALDMFIREETAIMLSGPQFLKIINQNNPALYAKTGVSLPIYGKTGVSDIDVMNIAVTSASKHRKEAADFAAFVTNGPNQLAFCKLVPILPSVLSAINDPFFSASGGGLEQKARAISARSLLKAKVLISGLPAAAQVQSIIQTTTQEVFLDKKSDKEAMKEAEAQINRLISK